MLNSYMLNTKILVEINDCNPNLIFGRLGPLGNVCPVQQAGTYWDWSSELHLWELNLHRGGSLWLYYKPADPLGHYTNWKKYSNYGNVILHSLSRNPDLFFLCEYYTPSFTFKTYCKTFIFKSVGEQTKRNWAERD